MTSKESRKNSEIWLKYCEESIKCKIDKSDDVKCDSLENAQKKKMSSSLLK